MTQFAFEELSLKGAYLITPFYAPDIRGGFIKDYSLETFAKNGIDYQLKEVFAPKLHQSKTRELFDKIESPLVSVLAEMESEGIKLDVDYLKTLSVELSAEAQNLQTKIFL